MLASISERLNKLVDPCDQRWLAGFPDGNEDATDSGFMIVQYTAAALVNDLATRASGQRVLDSDQRTPRITSRWAPTGAACAR